MTVKKAKCAWQGSDLPKIEKITPKGDGFCIQFEGMSDRDEAKKLTLGEIWLSDQILPKLPQDEFYWSDLEGLKVVNTEGVLLGSIARLQSTGSNDVLEIAVEPKLVTELGLKSKRALIPLLWDSVVLAVDLQAGQMQVDWPADYWKDDEPN
jgi:16S rRNA processing protein RimM